MKNGLFKDSRGNKFWYKDGELHREDGPAIEFTSGSKVWCINGKLHRLDGPAREYTDGRKYWYHQDQLIECKSQEEFERIIKIISFL